MKLTKLAIFAIRGAGRQFKNKLAEACGVQEAQVYRFIRENQINGDLTKAAALKVIQEETGLSNEQILEEEESETSKVTTY